MSEDRSKIMLVAGVLLILLSIAAFFKPWQLFADEETKAWRLTLVGKDGQELVLSVKDVASLPSYKGRGGFFSTVGVVCGPFSMKGVTLEELCNQVGGVSSKDVVMISAQDGYSAVFSPEQVMGEFITYDEDLKEVPHDELKLVLTYQEDGKPLPRDAGRPLRLALLGPGKGFLTEGSHWVKWVNKVEILEIQ